MIARFLWGQKEDRKKIHWKNLKGMCMEKEDEGSQTKLVAFEIFEQLGCAGAEGKILSKFVYLWRHNWGLTRRSHGRVSGVRDL